MPNISKATILTVVCGILAGIVFAFTAYNPEGGILLLFMPAMPLAVAGLALSARHCLIAAGIACVAAGLLAGPDYALFFAILILLPLHHFVRKALMWRGDEEHRDWHPVLPVLAEISLVTAAVFMVFALLTAHGAHGNLKDIIAQALDSQLKQEMENVDPKLAYFIRIIVDDLNFVLFAFVSWLWVIMIYVFALLANVFLRMNLIALRPTLALAPGQLPAWLPVILAISAVLSFAGNANDRYVGETVLLIFLLPYFLSGIASLHAFSASWRNRPLWLAAFYLGMAAIPWLAIFPIVKGIHTQTEELWKRHLAANDH